ncbi:MAG: DNA polymerase I [Erysipelotrichaceae bacterium]|nr:DNA polymerase I [Erysipelotrichaceae bacterium]
MKRMILVDGNSLMYRAYYGMAASGNLTMNSKGIYTNAIYAFARMMNHLIQNHYDNILVAFDAGKQTLRHEWMGDYKAGRSPMPDELRMQIAYIKEYLSIMHIMQYEQPLYEADDIIGTMAKKAEDAGYHVDIYSSDKDLLQLISDNTTIHLTKKGMTDLEDYNPDSFFEKYQIKHTQFVDLKALMGDKSDNLPGIPGIGEKKAIKYLQAYETLDGIIAHKDEITGADGQRIREHYESALLCKKMATILREFDMPVTIDDTKRQECDKEKLIAFYQELEFKSLLKEITLPQAVVEAHSDSLEYEIVDNPVRFKEILVPDSAMIFETFEYNYHRSPLIAIGMKNHIGTFIIEPDSIFKSMDFMLYLSDKDNHKAIFDYKRAFVLCKRLGIDLEGVDFDLLLATYILNPSVAKEEFKGISDYYEYSDVYYDEQIYGKGAKKVLPDKSIIYKHIAKKANCLYSLKKNVLGKLEEKKQLALLTDIEIPLSRVLGKMEFNGIKVDLAELERQKLSLETAIKKLEGDIYFHSKKEFNIASPKQLGTILFEDLAIPYPKKKGNSYSTDIEILQSIIGYHPIVPLIIEYRAKTKLYSTYVQGLREMIYPDQKVHTIFQQALTQTGRLSSVEPNLQNIPIRTTEGHLIRKMFIPDNSNNKLYSADYSQIELRVLAHMANVKKLIEAFNSGEDIHSKTAKEVFNKAEITSEDRRRAKAVNFGIVYGISAFGLATDLGITNALAADFIKKYYAVYPEIKEFMDGTIEFCKETGYVRTMKNRMRYIPDINSKIYMQREFAKRMAMNAPIQGSAADIIKIAMIKVDNEMEKQGLKSKLLIQVHDELVFEVYNGEEEKLQKIVRDNMQTAMSLTVPLIVDDSFGSNWYEVK